MSSNFIFGILLRQKNFYILFATKMKIHINTDNLCSPGIPDITGNSPSTISTTIASGCIVFSLNRDFAKRSRKNKLKGDYDEDDII